MARTTIKHQQHPVPSREKQSEAREEAGKKGAASQGETGRAIPANTGVLEVDDESAAFVRRKNDKTLHPPIARPAADYGDEADDEPDQPEGRRAGDQPFVRCDAMRQA